MNDESQYLSSLWDALESYVSKNDKQNAAETLIRSLILKGHDASLLLEAEGNCNYLDKALLVIEDEEDTEVEFNEYTQPLSSLWEAMETYIPKGDKQEAAEILIRTLILNGHDFKNLQDAEGHCNYLDKALGVIEEEEAEIETDLFDEYGDLDG